MPKIKIVQTPRYPDGPSGMKAGNQQNYGLWTNQTIKINDAAYKPDAAVKDVRASYPEADRDKANVEVEKGEIVVSPDLMNIYRVNGQKHYRGGTPIQADNGAYVISDYINTNPELIKSLQLPDPKTKKKQSWAEYLNDQVDPKYYNSLTALMAAKERGDQVDPYELNTAKTKLPDFQTIVSKVTLANDLTRNSKEPLPETTKPAIQSLQQRAPEVQDDTMYQRKKGGFVKLQSGGFPYPTPNDMDQGIYHFPMAFPGVQMSDVNIAAPAHMRAGVRAVSSGIGAMGAAGSPTVGTSGNGATTQPTQVDDATSRYPVPNRPRFNNSDSYQIQPNGFDMMAVASALSNPIHTYFPRETVPNAAYVTPTFDEANYYPIQAAQKSRMDELNQFAGPTTARAVGSYQPDQISGIIQETNRARSNNLQAEAQAKAVNAQTYNQESAMRAKATNDVYDKTIMSLEQRDVARRLKNNDIMSAGTNMVNNMNNLRYMQMFSPNYRVSGPFWNKIDFVGGKDINGTPGNSMGMGIGSREQIFQQNPGIYALSKSSDPKDQARADYLINNIQQRQRAMMFRSSRNFQSNMMNPYMASMMGASQGVSDTYGGGYDTYDQW